MRSEIEIIAETLNETIEKGEKLKEKKQQQAKEFRKSLTFNPMDPKTIGPVESLNIYTPYKWTSDGFMPHDSKHWVDQGKYREHTIKDGDYTRTIRAYRGDYNNTSQYYDRYINAERKVRAFRGFGKSVEETIDIVKAEVGTKHKYRDGRTYLKTDKGWRQVGESMGDRIRRNDDTAHDELDKHYRSTSTVKTHLKRHEDNRNIRKELQDNFTKKFEKMLDGPMPDEYKSIFEDDE